ncbi:MAG: ADP-ribosylglycohydrolase family protein [Sumerlaeia bacterium]
MQADSLRDKFLGAAMGLCVGEALGAQFETMTASVINMKLGDENVQMTGDKRRRLDKGEWTDDAGQFIAVMNSFNVCYGYDPVDIAGSLGGWIKHKPKRVGMHTGELVREIRENLDLHHTLGRENWIQSGGVKAGNGSLARCLVPGLFYHFDLELMIRSSIGTSQITHFDPRVVETALVLNFLLIQCLNNRFQPESLEHAISFLESIRLSQIYTEYVLRFEPTQLASYTNFTPFLSYQANKDAVPAALAEMKALKLRDLHNTGFCVHTLQVVCYALIHAQSYEEGISMIAKLGGDSDTNGAVGGCLLGAQYGLSGIPSEWRSDLNKSYLIASQSEKLLNSSMQTEEREYQEGIQKPYSTPPTKL